MLIAALALGLAQYAPPRAIPVPSLIEAPLAAAQTPCNPDPMKSLGCVAQRSAPARKAAAKAPMICNHDPLKGAACHAHVAMAKAEKWAAERSTEQLASTAD
jgi:hypothetical protein